MAEKKVAVNFEKAIKDLEKIVEDLESGDLSLEESLKAFEKRHQVNSPMPRRT